jgi:LuxR family maltose regulon positive regulatory protein
MDVAIAAPGDAIAPTKLLVPPALPAPSVAAAAGDRVLAWLALDPEDADPVRFWRCAIAALRTVVPGFGREASALLRAGPAVLSDAVIPLVAAEAAALDRPTMLVLDGLDALGPAAGDVRAQVHLLDARLTDALRVALVPLEPGSAARARTPGTPSAAVAAALAAGDAPAAAAVVAQSWEATLRRGEHATVAGWIDALPPTADAGEPALWLVRLWAALEDRRRDDAERQLASADPAVSDALRARGLLLHAHDALRHGDLGALARAIERADGLDPDDGFWHTFDAQLRGLAAFWRGHPRIAYRHFLRAAGLAEIHGDRLGLAYATGYLALLAAEGADRGGARRRLGHLEDLRDEDPAVGEHAIACAGALAEGRMLELAGAYESAAGPLRRAHALARRGGSVLEQAEPLLRLGTVHRACHRPAEAAACDAQAARLLAGCPDHGRLAGPAAAVAPAAPPRDALSPSELAVLRLLPSGLNQREIGAHLFLSVNTVKTHCRNIYAKLGAGSRDAAVARAHDLGLL